MVSLEEVEKKPEAYVLIMSGHTNGANNGRYVYGGMENGKPKYNKVDNHCKVFWTGRSWDCFNGGFSPESEEDSAVPPLTGYDRDKGACNIVVEYELAEEDEGSDEEEVRVKVYNPGNDFFGSFYKDLNKLNKDKNDEMLKNLPKEAKSVGNDQG